MEDSSRGCGVNLRLAYAECPRLSRYSRGMNELPLPTLSIAGMQDQHFTSQLPYANQRGLGFCIPRA
jgi:hypothetical protein